MGEEGIFGVFLSILGLTLFKQEGRKDWKRAKIRKLTLTPSLMSLDLGKNPNLVKMILIGCRSILELFWVKFQSAFVLGLVLKNFCIKEMMKFQRSCCQNFFKTPIFVLAIS